MRVVHAAPRRPQVSFLLSTVTPINEPRCKTYHTARWHPGDCPSDMQANIDAYNAMLPNVEAEYRARGFDVSLHDVNADARFETSDFWIWGIHFNTTGFQKMAARCTHHRTSNRTSQERLETALTANGLRRLDSRGVVQLAQGPLRLGADATGARSRTASSASGGVIGWDCDGLRRWGEWGCGALA
jgi:hypothetical protein